MIAAVLTSAFEMQHDANWLGDVCAGQSQVEGLKFEISSQIQPTFGIPIFCTRCDATSHPAAECQTPVHCDKCAAEPNRARHAHTHKTAKCVIEVPQAPPSPPVVIPCLHCVESTEEKRWKKAHTHLAEACGFAVKMAGGHCPIL
jgi:hypothetical protein